MDLQIFTPNVPTDRPEMVSPDAPIQPYDGYLVPGQDEKARCLGARCAAAVRIWCETARKSEST